MLGDGTQSYFVAMRLFAYANPHNNVVLAQQAPNWLGKKLHPRPEDLRYTQGVLGGRGERCPASTPPPSALIGAHASARD